MQNMAKNRPKIASRAADLNHTTKKCILFLYDFKYEKKVGP